MAVPSRFLWSVTHAKTVLPRPDANFEMVPADQTAAARARTGIFFANASLDSLSELKKAVARGRLHGIWINLSGMPGSFKQFSQRHS